MCFSGRHLQWKAQERSLVSNTYERYCAQFADINKRWIIKEVETVTDPTGSENIESVVDDPSSAEAVIVVLSVMPVSPFDVGQIVAARLSPGSEKIQFIVNCWKPSTSDSLDSQYSASKNDI